MDTGPLPTRIIRIDSRHRRQAQDVVRGEVAQVQVEEEEDRSQDVREPLLIREPKGRAVMGKSHRMFHRRQAQPPPAILTVNVEVVATLDTAGNVVALQTTTPAVATPAVATPAVPSEASVAIIADVTSILPVAAVPSVPSVPPFPSDLHVPSVPAYPWPSGVPTAQAADPNASTSSTLPESTPAPTRSSVSFPSVSGYNSTTSSTTSSTTTISFNATSSTSSSSSSRSSSLSSTESSITSTLTSAESSSVYWIATTTGGGGGGYIAPENTDAPATPSTAPANDTDSNGPLETPGVVGAVVGSLAGVALLLAFFLFLIRRHKQKQNGGALQLTGDDTTDNNQSMTHTPARNSFVPPSFLNRFSGASRSTADSSGTGERSFQRISGRKLPSAFSEGMTSEQFAAGRGEGTLSGSSFYQDEKGFYGGPGVMSKDFGEKSGFAKEIGETSNTGAMGTEERVRPSPARTPVIHHADDTPWGTLSPPLTPNPDVRSRSSLGRSHVSRDGSRSSRFTENV